jgi:hypothetical protein
LKRFLLILSLITLASALPGAAEEGVRLTIRLYNARIYYLNDAEHPVQIEAVITNGSPRTYRFKVADNRVFNFDLQATTAKNLFLEHSQEFTTAKLLNQPLRYREISLEPGEKFGLVIDLPDYIDVREPGLYDLRVLFYPELNLDPGAVSLRSNSLAVNIRPALDSPAARAALEEETGRPLERQAIPPDEVVAYTLHARQKSQWEKFLLYLDLESLYLKKPERARSFTRMSEEERKATLKSFEMELRQQTVDQDILVIPSSFEIVQTKYTPFEAEVLVIEKFQYRDYTEVKRYTYKLLRNDSIWSITDYDIQNLGTE